ncbi:MAG: hypothetical protein ACKVP3_16630 [Hyphomicrobiaceae bacterium]
MAANAGHTFGTCCDVLKDAMSDQDFDPLIAVGDDGILYMSVGLVDVEETEPGMVDYPVLFCPFCGKGLQTDAEIDAKNSGQLS